MKYILTIAGMLAFSLSGMATPRSAQQARQIAESFVGSAISVNTGVNQARAKVKSSVEMQNTPYYIYNIEGSKGFVIVSGDDKFQDILGYCPFGRFEEENIPDGLHYWLETLEKEMEFNISNEDYERRETSKVAGQQQSVGPLLTTTWGQDEPFNNLIPIASTTHKNGKAATGCIATAMAQIMNYWKYPERPTGRHRNENHPEIFEYLSFERYNWDIIPDHYGYYSDDGNAAEKYAEYTEEQANEIAKIMYHCGVTTDMKWGNSSYAANTSAMYALITYFKYNPNMHAEARDVYSKKEFRDLLLNELNNGRPIPYWAKTSDGMGHYFICDGYDANTGMFHFNWGWLGAYNGYYAISALKPETPEGQSAGFKTFEYQQFICVDCQPETTGTYVPMFTANLMKIGDISSGRTTTITVNNLTNSSVYYDEEIGVALIKDGEIKYCRMESNVKLMPSDCYVSISLTSPKISADFESGDYILCVIAKNDKGEFCIVKANYGTPYMWKISVDQANHKLEVSEIIREDTLPDAISPVEMDGSSLEKIDYFTLSGAQVEHPENGIYIKRCTYRNGKRESNKVIK